ncbi:MAG: acetyl-CoA carboxylase carboxyltransferase subunit alpha [Deinococcota bacterium]
MSLAFEKPINELQARIDDMRTFVTEQGVDLNSEIKVLEERLEQLKRDVYADLSRWQRVQAARASGRPTALDYIHGAFSAFNELHGDRTLGDDAAIVTGLAELDGTSVVVIGQQKGRDTKENIKRNFGMAHPSGYRKAMRMFDLADKFQLPVITLIDTPGAYPGIAAEEQGQAWVIAESIQRMSRLTVPAISVVIGEGGSGGALAVAVANRVLILENSIYSVISPESCAAILWRDASQAEHAAEALKLTAQDLLSLDVVDAIIKEPLGGAHRNPDKMVRCLGETLQSELNKLMQLSEHELLEQRYERFRKLGRVTAQEAGEGVRALESGETD